jgi:serine/threonine protein phosphatase PrpC
MQIISSAFSCAGPMRAMNQDRYIADDSRQVYGVFDGMGGHSGGEKAAELTLAEVLNFSEIPLSDGGVANEIIEEQLTSGVQQASSRVFQAAKDDPALKGMGTTATVFYHSENCGIVAHVGDSRAYLLRKGELIQLTQDHTFVNELILNGQLDQDKAASHPYAHVLTRAVGVYETVAVDSLVFELMLGDRIIICSDGFYDLFDNIDEMANALSSDFSVENIVEQMSQLPDARQGSDNATLVMLEVVPDSKTDTTKADLSRSEEVALKVEVLKRTSIFNPLELKDIVHLVQSGVVMQVAKGTVVVKEGEFDRNLYVIISGQMEVNKQGEHLALLNAGTHFGEMSLFLAGPRSASVVAECDSVLLELPFHVFDSFFKSSPRAGVEVLKAISREFASRLSESNER